MNRIVAGITAIFLLSGILVGADYVEPATDPATPVLVRAYDALRVGDYDVAIRAFGNALKIDPNRASVHKDLAYALLKIGENEAARGEFEAAMILEPHDDHLALEYAFLAYETGRKIEARRVFDRIRKTGDPQSRVTAAEAYENVDRPLVEGIRRWRESLVGDPGNFSGHRELARLADQRDEWTLARDHFEIAWRLRPDKRELLLDLGRLWGELGDKEQSVGALLAASRGAEPRTAEKARELLPSRYPYVSEFESALRLDPKNVRLRRELAFLLLQLDRAPDAERHLAVIVEESPSDLLSVAQLGLLLLERGDRAAAMPLLTQVLDSDNEELAGKVRKALGAKNAQKTEPEPEAERVDVQAKTMAAKSLEAGYVNDAVRYLEVAHRQDPTDFEVMLDLGKSQNMLKKDEEATQWFDLARRSPDSEIAAEAERAYSNLKPSFSRFRTTFWAMPFYSTRWEDLFAYAQVKTEVRFQRLPVLPYLSVRFAGDARRTIGSIAPQYLSESSFVFGVGLRTRNWRGLVGWIEAGSDVSYLDRNDRTGRMAPDYRGGVSFGKGFGNPLGGEGPGLFAETYQNGVFMSRFDNTFIGYSQNRFGYTPPVVEQFAGFQSQFYWNGNLTVDAKRQEWANFVEFGPGVRFRWKALPRSMSFSAELLRGVYLLGDNPRGPNYNDVRIGMWYAFTK